MRRPLAAWKASSSSSSTCSVERRCGVRSASTRIAEPLAAGGQRQHDQRGGAGAAQRLVAGEAAAGRLVDGVGRGAVGDPLADRGEVLRRQVGEGDGERAFGVVDVEAAVAVGEREHRRLEAGELERRAHGLAHEVLRILQRGQPRDGARQALRRVDRRLGAAELLDPACEQVGAALDLPAGVVAELGRRVGVEDADHAARGLQRHADLGDHGRDRDEELAVGDGVATARSPRRCGTCARSRPSAGIPS